MSATSASGKDNLPQAGNQCSDPLEESSSDSDLVLSDDDDADLLDGGKAHSLQEKKAAEDLAKRKRKQDEEFENKLDHIAKNPKLWENDENKYLREFFNYVDVNRSKYPFLPGDRYYDQSVKQGNEQVKLTQGYIKAIATSQDTSFAEHPILYVLQVDLIREPPKFTGFSDKQAPSNKITHLLLADGDGNQMTGRLSTHIADQGSQLKRGDIIRLDLYTELTHRINTNTARMPWVFVLKYSPVGYSGTLPVKKMHDPIPCSITLPDSHTSLPKDTTADVSDEPVECCPSNRYCSMHGVSFPVCICDAVPVHKLDLATIKDDCYFATDEMNKMTNPHKRNMIYW
eukprot:CAMPEP_0172328508 /NCGR_PEP_ID=MMETSP1058-20130122/60390_1 /TAXON_ID=83371 /ORGANISM="Detonula confervacea, Strain CCMP 353" /LENGTH=342 /DNA_ID=CAMNT_0013045625 /DNA_START=1319 /DNA_END=2344 /DNA_ORIENTATION=-